MRIGYLLVKAFLLVLAILLLVPEGAAAERPPHFSYPTKLMNVETGYLLGERGGRLKIGFGETGFGFHPRVQVTTNTMLDFISFLNAQLKLGILMEKGKIPALAVGGGYYNLVASGFIVNSITEEALSTEEEFELDSGLDSWYLHISLSKQLYPGARIHLSYQYRYISGYFEADEPITLTSGDDELSAYTSLDQSVYHRSFMSALDADLGSSLKAILEMGYDISYQKFRGGFALRLAATRGFAIQGGVLWPGIDLGDDFEMPVVPNLAFFWRY
ncbi:MAG: hypothetical protein GF417_04290 [Candidatus Latescibacteria bacterium]|nr:hypothetical protein [bacterium]MBD3423646.1 hypothetical protein [Candidatus Latescibacterota bacterium]